MIQPQNWKTLINQLNCNLCWGTECSTLMVSGVVRKQSDLFKIFEVSNPFYFF